MAEAKSTEYISRKCCCHFVAVVELCQNMKITVILKQLRWTMLKQQSRLSTELVFGYAATLGHTCTMWEEIWNHQNVSKLLAMPFCFFCQIVCKQCKHQSCWRHRAADFLSATECCFGPGCLPACPLCEMSLVLFFLSMASEPVYK